jgi:hypothetical protein
MQPQTLERRVEWLEGRVTMLEELPARFDQLELLIAQLGEQLRAEIRAGDEETRRTLREEIRAGDEETRRSLREEIRTADEQIRRVLQNEIATVMSHARLLHEDLVAKLRLIREGGPG